MPAFLFTDIENSTRLWEKHRAAMGQVLARHDAILQEEIARHGGRVIKHTGDGFFAIFEQGTPLHCALAVQARLAGQDWGAIGELRVRMAVHAGQAERRGDDYFGPVINRTARLLASGWGGQVLLTPEALQSYPLPEGATIHDLGFHFFKDLGTPQQVYGLTHPDLPIQQFPPLRTLSAHAHNLPPQPTPFLGREEELAAVFLRLDDPACRLLTLTGPGGIGKTRLALQAAAEKIERFVHGVYFVPLAPLNSPEFLVPTIADALSFSFYGRGDPKVQLFNYLREKTMLLLLDNMEHLLAGAGLVAEILGCAPQVKVLATSRERLNLRGEWVLPLGGMAIPPEEEKAAAIEQYSAVQLFLQSARRVQPHFAPTEEDWPAVVRVCQLVDGVPLGIELAASWVRALSCAEIVQEIEQSVDFLASAVRDLPERHRSLRAVFDYSWSLLSDEERQALRRLAVFRGGFRRDAAAAVAGATLPLLSALADKSLLRRDTTGRYDLLEVLRQYAAAKLAELPREQEETRRQHGTYYANFVQQREGRLKGGQEKAALEEIGLEIENIRAAWSWAVEQQDGDSIARFLEGLYLFFEMRSRFQEGAETFRMAAEGLAGASEPGAVLGRALARYAWCCERLASYEEAARLFQRSLAISRRLGDRAEAAFALANLGNVRCRLGEYEGAQELLHESLRIAQEMGDTWRMAHSLNNLGMVSSILGQHEAARRFYGEGLSLFQRIGYRRGIANALNNLGVVAGTLYDYVEARRLYQESLAIFKEIGDLRGTAFALNNLGKTIADAQHEYAETEKLCQESLAVFRQIGDRWGIANALNNLGAAARALLQGPTAWQYFGEALQVAMELRAVPLALEALGGMAQLLADRGNTEQAAELAGLLLEHPASDKETQVKAANLLQALATRVDPAALAAARSRGAGGDLDEIALLLLARG